MRGGPKGEAKMRIGFVLGLCLRMVAQLVKNLPAMEETWV